MLDGGSNSSAEASERLIEDSEINRLQGDHVAPSTPNTHTWPWIFSTFVLGLVNIGLLYERFHRDDRIDSFQTGFLTDLGMFKLIDC